MGVTLNSFFSDSQNNGTSTLTASGTVVGNKLIAITAVRDNRQTVPTSIQWDGSENFTKITDLYIDLGSQSEFTVSIWYIDSPTGATGNVVATLDSEYHNGAALGVWDLSDALSGAPTQTGQDNGVSVSSLSLGLSCGAGSISLSACCIDGTPTINATGSQTKNAQESTTYTDIAFGSETESSAGTATQSWGWSGSFDAQMGMVVVEQDVPAYSDTPDTGAITLAGGSVDDAWGVSDTPQTGALIIAGGSVDDAFTGDWSDTPQTGAITLAGGSVSDTFAGYHATVSSYTKWVENGGYCAHLWHVSGYPWAVTDDRNLIAALSATDDEVVQAARKRLFGTNEWTDGATTVTPAYSVPIFATLVRDFGTETWKLDESNGTLKGGDWSVKILDENLGHTWDHAAAGDEIWGLEGLHRVARVKQSSVHGWGYLEDNLLRSRGGVAPTKIDINEQSGEKIFDRIAALSEGEFLTLWLNREAIAVNAKSGTFPAYDATIAAAAELSNGRGLYRSRRADHFTSVLSGLNPIVADVPGGVKGKPCWLYSIPMVNNAICVDSDSDPVIAEIESGIISPNITTSNNITKLSIRSADADIDRTVNIDRSRSAKTSMAGFIFSRAGGGTDINSVKQYRQMPHLVIREFYVDQYSAPDPSLNIAEYIEYNESRSPQVAANWFEHYIWLCPKNTTVFFETVDDVMTAINDELAACSAGSSSQKSGSSSDDSLIQFKRGYKVQLSKGDAPDRYYGWNIVWDGIGTAPNYSSIITGPLAWVFALGEPLNNNNSLYDRLRQNLLDAQLRLEFAHSDVIPGGVPSEFDYSFDKEVYWMRMRAGALDILPTQDKRPKYYYQWDWASQYNTTTWHAAGVEAIDYTPTPGSWPIPALSDYAANTPMLFFPSGIDTNTFSDGEYISFGDDKLCPELTGQVDEFDDDDVVSSSFSFTSLKAMAMENDYLLDSDEKYRVGIGLFYLPLIGRWNDDNDENNYDPHLVQKSLTITTPSLPNALRAMLADTGVTGISLAKEVTLSSCPFFTTVEDFTSQIDWTSLGDIEPLVGQTYSIPIDSEFTVARILQNELLFHRCHMVREFDTESLMWKRRFRTISALNTSDAWAANRALNADEALPGIPSEHHGINDVYNTIRIDVEGAPIFEISNLNANIVGPDEIRTLEIKPKVSRFYIPNIAGDDPFQLAHNAAANVAMQWDLTGHFAEMLNAITQDAVFHKKGTTLHHRFFPIGKEILVTDPVAKLPWTHETGITNQPALIIESSWTIATNKGSITYKLGGGSDDRTTAGWAPACLLTTGNFSKQVGEWEGVPEDHEWTGNDQAKDMYFFDCYDLSDPYNPTARTSCSCADYKVWAIEKGTYNWTPLPFTCEIYNDSGTMKLKLTGTTTDIDTSKDYVIVFRDYDNLESCQKYWVMHADDSNTVGTAAVVANRWV